MRNLILTGFMGAGKTTVGIELSKRLALPLVDTDELIEEEAHMSIGTIFENQGEEAFRRMETAVLERLGRIRGKMVISTGGGLPLTEENRRLLEDLGTVAYLRVRPETVLKRLKGDTSRPLLNGEAGIKRIEELLLLREPIYQKGADLIVDVDGRSAGEIARELEESLE